MAKLSKLWSGLNNGPGGTYIRPHGNGFSYGRWQHNLWGWRFEQLGEAASMEAAREALHAHDKVARHDPL